jgi:predicted ArsR family transcriptional regulator
MAMDEWWNEVDEVILACLDETGEMSPSEIGCRLGMSEEAAASVLGMLAQAGRVRISRVQPVRGVPMHEPGDAALHAASRLLPERARSARENGG